MPDRHFCYCLSKNIILTKIYTFEGWQKMVQRLKKKFKEKQICKEEENVKGSWHKIYNVFSFKCQVFHFKQTDWWLITAWRYPKMHQMFSWWILSREKCRSAGGGGENKILIFAEINFQHIYTSHLIEFKPKYLQ